MSQSINTKAVTDRRDLTFNSLACVSEDLDRIQAAHDAHTLRTVGNWTPGQNLWHCAEVIRAAIDGFPPGAKPPYLVRKVVQFLFKKKAIRGAPPPPGIRMPKALASFLPPEDVPFDEGMSMIREQIARVRDGGERFTEPSPLFGEFTHEEWDRLQSAHCSMHFSFIKLDG
ncbi:MAG: DUF1569 domain-containing protein [Planctomycetota bacterium]